MSSRRQSDQVERVKPMRYYDAVGRPRKLAAGALYAIQREFKDGTGTRELAVRYGVSTSLILTICYMTPKGSPKRPEQPDTRQVVYEVSETESVEVEVK